MLQVSDLVLSPCSPLKLSMHVLTRDASAIHSVAAAELYLLQKVVAHLVSWNFPTPVFCFGFVFFHSVSLKYR